MPPKRKNISREYVKDDSDESEGTGEETKVKPKKQKVERREEAAEADEEMIPLSAKRFVKVRMFNGRYLVDIREYWSDRSNPSDELKPGRKGISLTLDQWEKLKAAIPQVDKIIHGD